MLFLDFQCPSCKSRRQTETEALVILCRTCGALLVIDTSGAWASAKEVNLAENPGDLPRSRFLERRQATVHQKIEQARRSRESDEWRMYMYEAKSIELAMDPSRVPEHTREAQKRWLLDEIALGELMTFNAVLRESLDKFKMAARRVKGSSDLPVVKEMALHATQLYRTLLEMPSCPASLKSETAEKYGKDMTLATLESYRRVLGPRVVDALIDGAFPKGAEKTTTRCPACQTLISDIKPGTKRLMCMSCGTLIQL